MVPSGTRTHPPAADRADHVCWVYADVRELRSRALGFLEAGLADGNRVEYLGEGRLDTLCAELGGLPGYRSLMADGRLTVRSLGDIYGRDAIVDPHEAVTAYATATEQAVADGYRGLTVVAEATALVRTPEQREAFARYEHLIDRFMTRHPFVALCAYDLTELGRDAATEIACLHPAVSDGASAFQWSAATLTDVQLRGEVDIDNGHIFAATLERTMPLQRSTNVVVDATRLGFIDHRGLLALERHAHRSARRIQLVTDAPMVHRLAQLLGMQAVAPEHSR